MSKQKRVYELDVTAVTPPLRLEKTVHQAGEAPERLPRRRRPSEFVFTPELISRLIERIKKL